MATLTHTCNQCSVEFEARHSQTIPYESRKGSVRKYCSPECYNTARRERDTPTGECPGCGIMFERRLYTSPRGVRRYSPQRYCSRKCARAQQIMPKNYGKGFIDKHGYRVMVRDGRYVPEHRFVMEQELGRRLYPHETVHHKNGNRTDNQLDNLELWSSRHGNGQRVQDKIEFCKSFLAEYGQPSGAISIVDYTLGSLSLGV